MPLGCMKKRLFLYLCCLLILGTVTGCGNFPGISSDTEGSSSSDRKNEKQADDLPPIQEGGSIQAPVAIPPSFDLPTPGVKQDAQSRSSKGALSHLQPMKSVNVETLFSEKIKDTGKRMDRVETAVLQLYKEFESLKPSIIRLVAVESDIQELVEQLDVLLQEESSSYTEPIPIQSRAPPPVVQNDQESLKTASESLSVSSVSASVSSAAAPEREPVTTVQPSAAYGSVGSIVVKDLRTGVHADKIRLVLDLTGKAAYELDLDNEEHLLVLELPNTVWQALKQQNFGKNSLLSSYTVQAQENGRNTQLIFSLKKPTRILQQKMLQPSSSNPNYRIFFDLEL